MSKTNHGSKGKEILEDPNAILDKLKGSEEFFEKNKKPITYVLGGLIVVILAFFGYRYWQDQNNEDAQIAMYDAVFAWEKDSLKRALEGDPKSDGMGLLDVADSYSGTDAGNLANYYAGVALLKQGKFDEAIEQLENFKSNDLLLQGLVYSLIGDAYSEKKDFENAAEYYSKAVNYKSNETFTPRYLMKLGLTHELNKDFTAASEAYKRIVEEYPNSTQITDAKKYLAKTEGLAAAK